VKPRFPRRAQIASNQNRFVWRKFWIDGLVVPESREYAALLARVQTFETMAGRQKETRRSPCGENAMADSPEFPSLADCRLARVRTP
jgi:hypothetical protein